MDRVDLERMYLEEHLTLEEIGKRMGITRQAVHYHVKRFGIDAGRSERFDVKCDVCGRVKSITRKRYLRSVKHFCSTGCYKEYLRNDEYRVWRQGQRIGRMVMESKEERSLRPGEVVHHVDGDNENNDPSNLMLFGSNADHIAYHHRMRRDKEA